MKNDFIKGGDPFIVILVKHLSFNIMSHTSCPSFLKLDKTLFEKKNQVENKNDPNKKVVKSHTDKNPNTTSGEISAPICSMYYFLNLNFKLGNVEANHS